MISAARQQEAVLEVREAIHDRLGGGHHVGAVRRALPTTVDATFVRDAAAALEVLLRPGREHDLRPIYEALTADEQRDVDFVRKTRAHTHVTAEHGAPPVAAALPPREDLEAREARERRLAHGDDALQRQPRRRDARVLGGGGGNTPENPKPQERKH